MNKGLIVFLIIFSSFELFSAQSEIKGTIKNPEGERLQAVTVKVIEAKKHASTNAKGEFHINDLTAGSYTFKLTRAGCRPFDTTLTLTDGVNNLDFVMLDIYQIKQNIVVTGTRTAKQIESNPIATDVVTSETIQSASRTRLDNVLNEELGMVLVEDHGKGVQIQGLDPDYALILLNGEPLIGRNGGILDVRRLAMGNIKRIEVVKGPSSSLYGSNALAGVINLITNEPQHGLNIKANGRYESYNTIDFGVEIGTSFMDGDLGNNIYVNRLSGDGFKLTEESYGKAVPKYENYTLSNEIFYKLDPRTSFKFGVRLNTEDQENYFNVKRNDSTLIVDDNSTLRDIGLSLNAKHQYNELFSIEARGYYTKYMTETDYTFRIDGDRYEKYTFDQSLAKLEFQWNWMFNFQHIITFGGGATYEDVAAQRLNDGVVSANAFHAFVQEDWIASKHANVIASLRYDWHSDYASNLSPKIAGSLEIFDGFTLKASLGSGFKAPTFQQLYLDWTNSIAGYSVFGVSFFEERFAKMQADGIIKDVLVNLNDIKDLKPEQSISLNLGMMWELFDGLDFKLNLFRNNISEMIETLPVANKESGAQVFTYFNLNSAYTQGLEFNIKFSPLNSVRLSFGYQMLEAIDEKVLEKVKKGEIFMNTPTGDRKVKESDYGGLMNRSNHSANAKIEYDNQDWGFNAFLRGNYRGRYGFSDKNSSGILDADNEYAPGYSIWNFTVSQNILEHFNCQLGIDNMFDKYDPEHLFSNPGRTFFINIVYRFSK